MTIEGLTKVEPENPLQLVSILAYTMSPGLIFSLANFDPDEPITSTPFTYHLTTDSSPKFSDIPFFVSLYLISKMSSGFGIEGIISMPVPEITGIGMTTGPTSTENPFSSSSCGITCASQESPYSIFLDGTDMLSSRYVCNFPF